VLSNGGLVAPAGTYNIAILAQHYGVPVCVCTGLYKLSPLYPQNKDALASTLGPSTILDYFNEDGSGLIDSVNPKYDYIPPELVNLYITNTGCHSPFYIYRLLDEYYEMVDDLV
jgi:translation initiation factor eIF-2B subunit beta